MDRWHRVTMELIVAGVCPRRIPLTREATPNIRELGGGIAGAFC